MCILKLVDNEIKIKLLEAKRLIEDGWCQHLYCYSSDGIKLNYCATGAMYEALQFSLPGSSGIKNWPFFLEMSKVFIKANNLQPANITIWNDDKDRTKEQVLQAFDKAIELA